MMSNSVHRVGSKVIKGINHPKLVLREINRKYYSARYGYEYFENGIDIFKQDWDTLIILDGCRYDMFENHNILPGKLEKRTSRASHTTQFLKGNFGNKVKYDTVYTTSSPQLERNKDIIDVEFHEINNVWSSESWNEDEGTVLPKDMTKIAVEMHDKFPNKRHIIHYMQPHYPFIGSSIDENVRSFGESPEQGLDIWDSIVRGEMNVSVDEIWEAYNNNLNLVLDSVKQLIEEIDGRIVVSSDHGNMVGERSLPIPIREWGHPKRLYTDELTTVPWLTYDSGGRRKIESTESSERENDINKDVVSKRLEDLGYV